MGVAPSVKPSVPEPSSLLLDGESGRRVGTAHHLLVPKLSLGTNNANIEEEGQGPAAPAFPPEGTPCPSLKLPPNPLYRVASLRPCLSWQQLTCSS